MELAIYPASLDHLDLILEWRMKVLHDVFAPFDPALESLLYEENKDYYQQHLADGSHLCFFLVDQSKGSSSNGPAAKNLQTGDLDLAAIIGCGGICLWQEMPSPDNHNGQCAYLMNIYVLPACRHHQAATFMVEQFLQICKERRIGKIYLETSQAGRSLYAKCGFIPLADYMIYQKTQNR